MAAPASAYPLGLQIGDSIDQIEWDALSSTMGTANPQGGFWDVGTGIFHGNGRLQAVNLTAGSPSAPSIPQSDTRIVFDLGLASHNLIVNLGTQQAYANALMPGAFTNPTPSFSLYDQNVLILTGQFVGGGVLVEGNFDLSLPANVPQIITASGAINITGGDPNLVAALGANLSGPDADIFLSASVFDFDPSLVTLALTGNIFGQDFNVSMSGSVTPRNPAPFVPEPSTALLLGFGMVGLLGVSRRLRGSR